MATALWILSITGRSLQWALHVDCCVPLARKLASHNQAEASGGPSGVQLPTDSSGLLRKDSACPCKILSMHRKHSDLSQAKAQNMSSSSRRKSKRPHWCPPLSSQARTRRPMLRKPPLGTMKEPYLCLQLQCWRVFQSWHLMPEKQEGEERVMLLLTPQAHHQYHYFKLLSIWGPPKRESSVSQTSQKVVLADCWRGLQCSYLLGKKICF